jgi:tetratricopeptide (TPR) repeat protein
LLSKFASCEYKIGNIDKANALLKKIEGIDATYNFGKIDYALAQYYATIGEKNQVMKHLFKAVSQGNLYTPISYFNDPIFAPYFGDTKFKNILTYWH